MFFMHNVTQQNYKYSYMRNPMTIDYTMRLSPGPKLDRLVAEKVMGWKGKTLDNGYFVSVDQITGVFRPSEIIEHAWKVVEKMQAAGHCIALGQHGTGWNAEMGPFGGEQWGTPAHFADASAPTAPHAICLAALLVIKHAPLHQLKAES